MRDVAEATTPRGQPGDISQKILLAEHDPQDAKQVLQLVVIDVAGQTTANSLAIGGRRPAGDPYKPPNPDDGLGRASSLSRYCTVDQTNKNRPTPPGGRT
jgi:hypothetical protein